MKKHTAFVIAFLKEHGIKELLDKWEAPETQDAWKKIYVVKKSPKKRCTCYILFCIDKREGVKALYPLKTPAAITSMLAAKWRGHKDSNDEVYQYYKKMDHRQVFYKQKKEKICDKYPHLTDEEINIVLEKMYLKKFS